MRGSNMLKARNHTSAWLLLLSFALLIATIAFHSHNDGVPHSHCSICLVAQQPAVTSLAVTLDGLSTSVETSAATYVPVLRSDRHQLSALVRAPPGLPIA
jgi:hypothetical protein